MMARPEIESSVQMRLYSLTKRQFIVVFLVFTVAFVVFLLVGVAGPRVISTHSLNATCRPEALKKAACFEWDMMTPTLTVYNQQLWLIANVKIKGSAMETDSISKMFSMSVGKTAINSRKEARLALTGRPFDFNRTRTLSCRKKDEGCDDVVVLHLGFLDAATYRIRIMFHGLESKGSLDLSKVDFTLKTYNPFFTELEIWFRIFFLFLSFIVSCWYVQAMKKFAFRDWCLEQRFLALLLPLLLFYNNPVFPLNFLTNSWVPGMLDGFFQASFLCSLLLFWICLYHGIRHNERHFLSFYAPKLVIVGLIWLAAFTLSTWQCHNSLRDPTYSTAIDTGNFTGFKSFFFIVGSLYVLYLLYLLVRAFAELKSLPYFDLRLKFLTILMMFVLSVSVAIFVLRFGSSVLQDNFVAELSSTYQNSAEFLTFYSLLNLYIYLMAYVYSPSKNAVYETHFRDNPTMSMLNETDDEEEVIYTSEEDLKLTAKKKTEENKTKQKQQQQKQQQQKQQQQQQKQQQQKQQQTNKKGKNRNNKDSSNKSLMDDSEEDDLFNLDYSSMPF